MKRFALLGTALVALAFAGPAAAQDAAPLKIVFTHHSSPGNVFWQAVKRGFEDACALVKADCQMVFTQTEGSIEQQIANMNAALAGQPDALITSIVDNNAFDGIIQDARDQGVIVIASNVDDLEGAKGNARQAFIGQGFDPAGYALAEKMSELFPAEGPIRVLVGISSPGQNWSEQRGGGVMRFMQDYKDAHPDRDISWERIDSGTDLAVAADRFNAYYTGHPDLTAYFDTGYWHAGAARVLKDAGVEPGKVLLGGFDLVPEVLTAMKEGYIQVEVDQQPYLQGYLPVIQVNLMKTLGLSAWDVDTGQGLITPDQVDNVMALSEQGLR